MERELWLKRNRKDRWGRRRGFVDPNIKLPWTSYLAVPERFASHRRCRGHCTPPRLKTFANRAALAERNR